MVGPCHDGTDTPVCVHVPMRPRSCISCMHACMHVLHGGDVGVRRPAAGADGGAPGGWSLRRRPRRHAPDPQGG